MDERLLEDHDGGFGGAPAPPPSPPPELRASSASGAPVVTKPTPDRDPSLAEPGGCDAPLEKATQGATAQQTTTTSHFLVFLFSTSGVTATRVHHKSSGTEDGRLQGENLPPNAATMSTALPNDAPDNPPVDAAAVGPNAREEGANVNVGRSRSCSSSQRSRHGRAGSPNLRPTVVNRPGTPCPWVARSSSLRRAPSNSSDGPDPFSAIAFAGGDATPRSSQASRRHESSSDATGAATLGLHGEDAPPTDALDDAKLGFHQPSGMPNGRHQPPVDPNSVDVNHEASATSVPRPDQGHEFNTNAPTDPSPSAPPASEPGQEAVLVAEANAQANVDPADASTRLGGEGAGMGTYRSPAASSSWSSASSAALWYNLRFKGVCFAPPPSRNNVAGASSALAARSNQDAEVAEGGANAPSRQELFEPLEEGQGPRRLECHREFPWRSHRVRERQLRKESASEDFEFYYLRSARDSRRPPILEFGLRVEIEDLLRALESSGGPKLARELISFFFIYWDSRRLVVWFSRSIYLLCAPVADGDPLAGREVWCAGGGRCGGLTLRTVADDDGSHAPAIRALSMVVGLTTKFQDVYVKCPDGEDVPGIDALVSHNPIGNAYLYGKEVSFLLCRSVELDFLVSPATGRDVARHCHPRVELVAEVTRWADHGASLAEAMLANQCPATLDLNLQGLDLAPILALAGAIEQTVGTETLTVRTDPGCHVAVWQAIGRNKSVRVLKVHHSQAQPSDLMTLMASISGNPTLWSVQPDWIFGWDDLQAQALKTENAQALLALVEACPTLVHFSSLPRLIDGHIVKWRVQPVFQHRRALLPRTDDPFARPTGGTTASAEPVSAAAATAAADDDYDL